MKRKIIVPVDFSTASHNTYLYARDLAVDYDAVIEVVHVYNDKPGQKTEHITKEMEKLKVNLTDFINLYPNTNQGNGTVLTETKVSIRLLRGLPIKSIISLCEFPSSSIIVMGMTGRHNAVGRFFGTVSSSVAQKANCPVLLIPSSATYVPYKGVLYASNFESAERAKLNQVSQFADLFKATIHFIHVRSKDEIEDFTETEKRIFELLFEGGDPKFPFNLTAINSESVTKGLNQYAEENDIDLITLVNNQRGFLESLFGLSMTKTMAFQTKLPLMIFHLP